MRYGLAPQVITDQYHDITHERNQNIITEKHLTSEYQGIINLLNNMEYPCSKCGNRMTRSKGNNFYPYKYTCTKKGCHHAKSPLYGRDTDFADGRLEDVTGDSKTYCETRKGILCIQRVEKKKVKKRKIEKDIDSDLCLNY